MASRNRAGRTVSPGRMAGVSRESSIRSVAAAIAASLASNSRARAPPVIVLPSLANKAEALLALSGATGQGSAMVSRFRRTVLTGTIARIVLGTGLALALGF